MKGEGAFKGRAREGRAAMAQRRRTQEEGIHLVC